MDAAKPPTYEQLQQRLREVEATLQALRTGELDRIAGEAGPLVVRLMAAEEKAEHIKQVLLAIRNVNQLIVSEDDPHRLIERACANLTETLGYVGAWIVLLPEAPGGAAVAQSARGDSGFPDLRGQLETGDLPQCMRQAMETGQTRVVRDAKAQCGACPHRLAYAGLSRLVRRLFHDGKVFGVLSVCVPATFVGDPEEQALFEEVAGDLAFALHKIEAAARLRESRNRLQSIFRSAPVGIGLIGPGRIVRDINERICAMTGYAPEELLGQSARILYFDDAEFEFVGRVKYKMIREQGIGTVETRWRRKDGTGMDILLSSTLMDMADASQGVSFTALDITEHRAAQRNYETLFREMIDGFALHEMVFDSEGRPVDYRFLSVNPAFERLTGLKADHIVGRTVLEVLPGTEQAWIELYGRVVTTGEPASFESESKVLGKWFEVTAFRPAPGQFACFFLDVTDRRRTEGQNRVFADIIRRSGDFIGVAKANQQPFFIDPAGLEMVGLEEGKLAGGIRIEDFFFPEDLPFLRETILPAVKDTGRWSGEFRFRHFQTGAPVHVLYDLFRTEDMATGEITNFATISRDIRERKALEAQLRQSQKMESIGRLAGGVAHDFNNMLGAIMGNAELAMDNLDPAHPIRTELQEILAATKRSSEVARQLLAFARKQTIAPKVLDLNETVEGMLKMLGRLIGEDIDLAWRPTPSLWPVKVDPSQVNQILANLCVNARDAIRDVGKVSIETGMATFDAAFCADHSEATPGDYVLLVVRDNGCGMDRLTLDHLFEPFFTTKEVGKGTGLGLATVYGIVRQNNGFITVQSGVGQGTTFQVCLPRHVEAIAPVLPIDPEGTPVSRGETLLVVEDEPAILQLGRTLLRKLGYIVLAAGTPEEAIRVASVWPNRIDLLITDVVMPEMNGRDLARRLQNSHPGLKVLFMSGYTANVIAHHGVLDAEVLFIQKPFTKNDLATKVRQALASPPSSPG